MTRTELAALADHYAAAAGVDPRLVRAMITQESSWNPRAHRTEQGYYRRYIQGKPEWESLPWGKTPSRVAASYGLMQLMYPTAVQHGYPRTAPPEGLYDVHTNLRIGANLAGKLWRKYGNLRDTIAAYNSGQPYSKAPKFTRDHHVPAVLRNMAAEAPTNMLAGSPPPPAWFVPVAMLALGLLVVGVLRS